MASKRRVPSHEAINTMIAAAALLLAGITAWFQFAPEADQLQVVTQQRVRSNSRIRLDRTPLPLPNTNEGTMTLGPVIWRVVLFNPTSHPVALTGIDLAYAHPQGEIWSSYMLAGIQSEPEGRAVDFPVMLVSHEARALLIYAVIPAKTLSQPAEMSCRQRLETLQAFESCLFDQGRDIFGNRGTRIAAGAGFRWDEEPVAPIYMATIRTATGYVTRTPLTYYPAVGVSR